MSADLVRKGVTHKADDVWEYNKLRDLYTRWHKTKVVSEYNPQVDHIVECQLGQHIWDQALDGRMTTRGRLAPIRDLWNSLHNLNNTPDFLNLKKRDAFKRWLAGQEDDLRSALRHYDVASNHTIKIVEAFEDAADWIIRGADKLHEKTGLGVYDNFACELDDWLQNA